MPDTVPADAGYRSSGCRIPFQRMPDTVPADAGYRSSGCAIHRLNRPETSASAGFQLLAKTKLIPFLIPESVVVESETFPVGYWA
jgi:hypothetical protein